MLRCITEITFTPYHPPFAGQTFAWDFVNHFEVTDTWTDLTNTCKIVFPKNVYIRDPQNRNYHFSLGGTNDDKTINRFFNRGDKITVNFGYLRQDKSGNEIKDMPKQPVFSGYISKVKSKIPIELECEDYMWLLKQTPCKPQTWPRNKSVEELFKTLLGTVNSFNKTNLTIDTSTHTSVGNLVIKNESVGALLKRLRDEYHLEAYFKGNELRMGMSVYKDSDHVNSDGTPKKAPVFIFQNNIISDELEFQRKEDIKLSAVCESTYTTTGSETNKQGQPKTQRETLSVLVYSDSSGTFKYQVKQKDVAFPENEEGERRSFKFTDINSAQVLADNGIKLLEKYYYTGFRGKFTTFGIPFVTLGDYVQLNDPVMPDRNGTYLVKSVKYTGGVSGLRQIIELDYKLPQ